MPGIAGIDDGDVSQAYVAHPYPIYISDYERLSEQRFFEDAELAGWQYIVFRADDVLALANATYLDDAKELTLAEVEDDGMGIEIVEAINGATEITTEASDDFELRLLNAPSIPLHAIWLFAEATEGNGDLLFLVSPLGTELTTKRPYSREEVITALRQIVESRSSTDEFQRR